MPDVATLLAQLDLSQYDRAFSENAIDEAALRLLNDADLKELGIVALGHRKKLLAAIAALDAAPATSAPGSLAPKPAPAAERRQLTVMFVDLVGSTALTGRLDPEEMGRLIRAYQNVVAGEIARFDGHVAKFMGDGVLAYFGWPRAHENEAERAVHAGLAILGAIGTLPAPDGMPLAARIGIATGLVVVGDLVGEGSAREEAVVGETPNLAARLQSLAEPDQIVVAESTRRLVGGQFELDPLGKLTLKGLAEPVPAYAVLGERTLESRFAAHSAGRLNQIVGREQELALLLERWEQACSGEGQMILLTGEAGIGKSRITEALIESLANTDYTRIRYQCSPYHTDSALHPAIQHLGLAARIDASDDESARLDKLEALLALGTSDVAAQAPLIAPLLGLDGSSRYGPLSLSPEQLRTWMLQALVNQLSGLARSRPVLWIIEDAHWIDPTTLAFVETALDAAARARVLILITARPTFEHSFGGHPIVTRLMLNRLGRNQIGAIAMRVSAGKTLPDAVLDEIAAKTDGVPLFVEEIAKAVLESGVLREEGNAYVLTGPLNALSVPATLHDSLMARLDRLQSVKEVAQVAAVIGRNFDYRTLSAIAHDLAHGLDAALESLVEAELVFRRGIPPDADYLFKHALVRDAAYESLLKSRRQSIHGRLLAVLEANGAQPEILAHHAEQAGETSKAFDYWERAGNDAVARPAYRESISHFENALRLLRQGTIDRNGKEHELRLLVSLGQAHIPASGYAAPPTVATFARAVALADEIGNTPFRFSAMYGDLAGRYLLSVEDPARAERFLALTEQAGDQNARLAALRLVAVARFHLGRYSDTVACADEILTSYDPVQHRDHALRYGHDPRSSGFAYKSWSLWHLGFPERATDTIDQALDLARQRSHGNTAGYSLVYCGMIANTLMRRVPAILEIAQRALPISAELAMPMWHNYARVLYGWATAQQGGAEAALPEMSAGIAGLLATGTRRYVPFLYGLMAEAHALAGQTEESDAAIAEALRYLDETGDLACAPMVQCIAGSLQARRDTAAAELAFETARAMARTHGSKGVELRAAIGIAQLRRNEGRSREARAVLAPVYEWFTEGFGTPDLIEAVALLDELRP